MIALLVVPAVAGLYYFASPSKTHEARPAVAREDVTASLPPDVPYGALKAARPPAFPAAPPFAAAPAGALAYAPQAGAPQIAPPRAEFALPGVTLPTVEDEALPLALDADAMRQVVALYRKGDLAAGDEAGRRFSDPVARTALEWAALRLQPRPAGYDRIVGFLARNPGWPSADWLAKRAEESLYGDRKQAALIKSVFARRAPLTSAGKLALARVAVDEGRTTDAASAVAAVWRQDDLGPAMEQALLREFGHLLTRADHKYRADRLLYDEKNAPAMRAAALAGADVAKLAKARALTNDEGTAAADAAIAAVPKELQADPGLIFARAQKLRRAQKFAEAAAMIETAPREAAALIDGDAWWTERRIVARKLLDAGEAATAYRLAAGHSAQSSRWKVEAEFHAGWIALRFLDGGAGDARLAKIHFDRAAAAAESPQSIARAAYWQGRAAEQLGDDRAALAHFRRAAGNGTSFYGQLARARLDWDDLPLRIAPAPTRESDVARVVELLYSIGEKQLALPLAADAARGGSSEEDVAAIGEVLRHQRDARALLILGKLATQRGAPLDEAAFPIFGVPDYQAVGASAEKAIVYSIARQESAFQTDVVSHAGAKGLMQMLTATARRTAERAGVAFDERRLLSDPAFNAQLGAAHLGDLLGEQSGSYILTFAAYNAGGGRVKQWIAAYGDPRDPAVDPVDWIERIPFSETRDYVQKIMENLQVYRARLGERSALLIQDDLRRKR
ncbi:MAG: lytic transglycosylase domain-containing protein [Rhizobiales bacterium]|nr:lytic transglycosylase domain-containing protein [Hyphomicrobiales bacterium]